MNSVSQTTNAVVYYSDVRTPEGFQVFLDTTSTPNPSNIPTPLENPTQSIDYVFLGMPLPPVNEEMIAQPTPPKRIYVKITVDQWKQLVDLYQQHGDSWTVQQYSIAIGIKANTLRNLISKLRKNEDIMPVRVRNERRRIISREIANTIIEGIRENNQITLKEMRTKVIELNGVVVYESTISRYLSFPESYGSDIPNYVLKRCHNRPPSTNSPENKEFRDEKVIEQYNAKRSGRILTYVDETSINLASVRNYG